MTWRRAVFNDIGQDCSVIKVCSGHGNENLHFVRINQLPYRACQSDLKKRQKKYLPNVLQCFKYLGTPTRFFVYVRYV